VTIRDETMDSIETLHLPHRLSEKTIRDTQTNHFTIARKLRSSAKRSSKHTIPTYELDTTEQQLGSQPDHKKPQSPQGRWCSRTPFKKPAQKGRSPLTPLFT